MNAQTPNLDPQAVADPTARPVFADGVYFDLDETLYRKDPALGSTDIKKLSVSPADYWWGSAYNAYREPDKDTPARILGRAVHRYVLEGRDRFLAEYAPLDLSGNNIAARHEREAVAAEGRTGIKRSEFDRILAAGTMIRANPHLSTAFQGGRSEVSIVWTANGIRRKARIDYMKPRANVDLKSIANSLDIDFVEACRRQICQYRYDIQAEHYLEARAAMRSLVAAGAVWGDHDPAWLRACAEPETYAHVLLFWQKEHSPLTYGVTLSAGNSILEIARHAILRAEDNWRTHVERFGFDTPWLIAEPLAELDLSELPQWFAR